MKTEIKMDNLPKWAKNKIDQLEANVTYWKDKANEINGEKDTNTFIQYGMNEDQPLPKNASIKFNINERIVTIRIRGESLDVNYNSFSSPDRMLIASEVSNAISIVFAKIN